MENDLISRSALIEEINERTSNIAFSSPYQDEIEIMREGMERALNAVEDAPAVDAVVLNEDEWRHIVFSLEYRIWKMKDQGRDLVEKHLFNRLNGLRYRMLEFGAIHFGKTEV